MTRRATNRRPGASTMWSLCPDNEMTVSASPEPAPTLTLVFTTLLTKRRAVDHCLVRSSLCCMS